MMNYEEFKKNVTDKFLEFMPEECRELKVKIISVNKVNRSEDELNLVGKDTKISPTMYITAMYNEYCKVGNFEAVMQKAADRMYEAMQTMEETMEHVNFDNPEKRIIFTIVNTEQNEHMLANVPHRQFLDLSIVYRFVFAYDERLGCESTTITNDLAEHLGFTEEQLYEMAYENTKNLFPTSIMDTKTVMEKMLVEAGAPEEVIEELRNEGELRLPMFVISNSARINGASGILYKDVLEKLASELEDNLFIMPSSIHEVLAVRERDADEVTLINMVGQVNDESVEIGERLSYSLYRYDRNTKEISIASANFGETPKKKWETPRIEEV